MKFFFILSFFWLSFNLKAKDLEFINVISPKPKQNIKTKDEKNYVKIIFSWQRSGNLLKNNVNHYVFFLAKDKKFQQILSRIETNKEEISTILPSGNYYWKVFWVENNKKKLSTLANNFLIISDEESSRENHSDHPQAKWSKSQAATKKIDSELMVNYLNSTLSLNFQVEDFQYKKLGLSNLSGYSAYLSWMITQNIAIDLTYTFQANNDENEIKYHYQKINLFPFISNKFGQVIFIGFGSETGELTVESSLGSFMIDYRFYNLVTKYEFYFEDDDVLESNFTFGSNVSDEEFAYRFQVNTFYKHKFFKNSKKSNFFGTLGLGYEAVSVTQEESRLQISDYNYQFGLAYHF